jgi:hypothetical protein
VSRGEQAQDIYRRAYELAATGLHLEPITIVATLIREGYAEADKILDNPLIRADLRLVCSRNWPGNVPVIVDAQELRIEPAPEQDNRPVAPGLHKARQPKH